MGRQSLPSKDFRSRSRPKWRSSASRSPWSNPGFFRTDLLDARNIRWVSKVIEDYAPEGTAKDMWSQYDGTQPGDPAKLGDALVKIAAMQNPPKVFIAGGDALDVIKP